jgi:ubiquinone/menaquinone biosynthesis C-methylase UbiE
MKKKNITTANMQIFLRSLGKKRFFEGIYYFKYLEYPLVWNHLNLKSGEQYLDIGSGYSVFPLFVFSKSEVSVNVMDDESMLAGIGDFYQGMLSQLRRKESLDKEFLIHITRDNTGFPFQDEAFHKISCISTIEHQRFDGDIQMIRQIFRVLKKGGKAVITFPFNNGESIITDREGFFERKYSIKDIKHRLVDASGLKVEKVIYFGERFIKIGQLYAAGRLRRIQFILPFFSSFFWRVCHQYEGNFHDFHETEIDKKGIGVALIMFSKPNV